MSAQVSRLTAEAFASVYQAVAHSAGRVEVLEVSELSDPHPPAVDTG